MVEGLDVRLRLLRYQRKLTQKQVAERTGIDNSTLSGYETGNVTPSLENVVKLAQVYKTSSDYLLGIDNRAPIVIEEKLSDENMARLAQLVDLCLSMMDKEA